jgi:hypothetical protein
MMKEGIVARIDSCIIISLSLSLSLSLYLSLSLSLYMMCACECIQATKAIPRRLQQPLMQAGGERRYAGLAWLHRLV